jgi:PAS domain S-box-containing protein
MPTSPPASQPRVSISRKVILGVAFTLIMLAMIAFTSWLSTRRFLANSQLVAETRAVLELNQRALWRLTDIESGVRGYLLSGDPDFLVPYEHGLSFVIQDLQNLDEMLRTIGDDAPEQLARLERMKNAVRRAFAHYSAAIQRRREGGVNAAALHFVEPETRRESAVIFDSLQDDLNEFDQWERGRLKMRWENADEIGHVNTSLVIGGTSLTYIALLVACLFVLRDIAARRNAEEQLEIERNLLDSIMNTIPDHIFVKDTQGRYLRDNAAHRRHLGVTAPAQVIGKTVRHFFPEELAKRYEATDAVVLKTGEQMLNIEEPSLTSFGKEIWIETVKVPFRSHDHRLIGLVGISSDITQRRADQERLKHFAQALQKSNEELQNFASVASHDLQEPLRKIQAFGDRLRVRCGEQLGEQGLDFLARMLNAAERMQVLIQDLLKLSRVTTRAQPFEQCDLDEVLNGVLSDLEVKIATTAAQIQRTPLGIIEADATQMRQLFQNLLTNALKFHKPDEPPCIEIRGRTFENTDHLLPGLPVSARLIEIQIRDHGIGFEPRFAEQIFAVFQRLHTRSEYEGTGIGLSVCRKITDRHRGHIMATSAAGDGATFTITLPIHQPIARP